MTKKCQHKHQFHKMVYPLKVKESETDEIKELDTTRPEIESICADCGKWLRCVKVLGFIK